MRSLMLKLWNDDGGALISVEWVFVATILVLGVTVGLVAVRNAVDSELVEFANAVSSLAQCYSFSGLSLNCPNTGAGVCGSNTGIDVPHTQGFIGTGIPAPAGNIDVSPCQ